MSARLTFKGTGANKKCYGTNALLKAAWAEEICFAFITWRIEELELQRRIRSEFKWNLFPHEAYRISSFFEHLSQKIV